jgi:hypothetical protein
MGAQDTAGSQDTTEQTKTAEGDGERTYTQSEVDRMIAESVKTGYVKADEASAAKDRADKAEAELAKLKAAKDRDETVAAVADKAGVPVEFVGMLNGADADELEKQVERVKKLLPAYPTRKDDGGGRATGKKTNADRFAEAFGL